MKHKEKSDVIVKFMGIYKRKDVEKYSKIFIDEYHKCVDLYNEMIDQVNQDWEFNMSLCTGADMNNPIWIYRYNDFVRTAMQFVFDNEINNDKTRILSWHLDRTCNIYAKVKCRPLNKIWIEIG